MKEYDTFGQRLMWVIWPGFLVAAGAETIFFTFFDPFELSFFGAPLELSRQTIYTLFFFGFWALGAASSALTVFLERSPWETNRCTIAPVDRPDGCPKRPGESSCGAVEAPARSRGDGARRARRTPKQRADLEAPSCVVRRAGAAPRGRGS